MGGEAVTLSFSAALLLGLTFGAGPCNIACLPYLGPVFLAAGGGVRRAWRILLPFSLGRLTGYTALGLVAGAAGELVQVRIDSQVARWLLGGATLLVAAAILLRSRNARPRGVCPAAGGRKTDTAGGESAVVHLNGEAAGDSTRSLLPGGLFLMGLGMAANPCLPLSTILLAAAATGSAAGGGWLGLGFGTGAVLIPALVFGLGIAHLGTQLRVQLAVWQTALTRTSAFLIAVLGVATAVGWTHP